MNFIKSVIQTFTLEKLVKRVLCSYLVGTITILLTNSHKINSLKFVDKQNFLFLFIIMIPVFLIITELFILLKDKHKWVHNIDDWILVPLVVVFLVICCSQLREYYFSFTACLVAIMTIYFCFAKNKIKIPKITDRVLIIFTGIAILSVIFFAGVVMAFRYLTFSAPCFDFGIFTQMFENMKDTFIPITTCERNELLSHFAIHFSPAYYFMLPFYMLAPNPITLQLLQGIFLASSIIPIFLICRHKKLSNNITLAVVITFALYPALTGGCSYDLHENMMLTPFLLWLFYFIEKEKLLGILIFAVMTLMIKEDAAVYVAVIALYVMFGKKMWAYGLLLFGIAIAYFMGACWYLETFGRGIMSSRYVNLIGPDGSLIDVIIAAVLNPGLMISECIDENKIIFILQMLLPVCFIPFMTKKFSRYILLIPFILINLLTDYYYQHSIEFQYVFGVIAIFFYMTIINLSDMPERKKYTTSLFAPICSLLVFATFIPGELQYLERYKNNNQQYELMFQALEEVPRDKTIGATWFLVPALYKQKELYEITSSKLPDVDIAIIDIRYGDEKTLIDGYLAKDYVINKTGNSTVDGSIVFLYTK